MIRDGPRLVLLRGLYKIELVQNAVEHNRGRTEVMIWRKDREEIVEVMRDMPIAKLSKHPVDGFSEEVEDAGGCSKTER